MFDINTEFEQVRAEMLELYKDLHQHPELGFNEKRTSAIVAQYLKEIGLTVRTGFAQTGVTGFLKGNGAGKTILLRADMDALPVHEETGLPYASKTAGLMHACGHDAHTAMLLVTAKILARNKDTLNGNVLFVFEPNEEIAGARQMIDDGAVEGHEIDACFAIHLWTPLKTGQIGLAADGVMAGMEEFHITLKGKAGHTGAPHLSKDPILAAADLIQALQAIQTRQISPLSRTVIMVGRVQAGTVCNAIPETAELDGTIRFLYQNTPNGQERPLERFKHIIEKVCALHDMEYDLSFVHSNKTVYNDASLISQIRPVAEDLVGKENIVEERSLAGEDFSEFGDIAPSAFIFVGAGNEAKNTHWPHHHPKFQIDADAMNTGVKLHLSNVLSQLA